MSSQMIPVDPFDYVVFGATGDLTERKLLPALYHRQISGQFTDPTRIIGASRSELTSEQFRKHADKALKEHLKEGEYDKNEVAKFLARIEYVPVDATSNKGWDALKKILDEGKDRVRAFYMAVAPSIFGPICDRHPRSQADHQTDPHRGRKASRARSRFRAQAQHHDRQDLP